MPAGKRAQGSQRWNDQKASKINGTVNSAGKTTNQTRSRNNTMDPACCSTSRLEHESSSPVPGPVSRPLIGGLPVNLFLIGQQAAFLQLAQLKAQLALTQIALTANSQRPAPYIPAKAPSPTAAAISLLNLLKIANTMSRPLYNPYVSGNRSTPSSIQAESDTQWVSTQLGHGSSISFPGGPSGAPHISGGMLPSLLPYSLSYTPEHSRALVNEDVQRSSDMDISRTREEEQFLSRQMHQPTDQSTGMTSNHHITGRSESESSPSSLSWLSDYSRPIADNSSTFHSASVSSGYEGGGEWMFDTSCEGLRDKQPIPGLGDYDYSGPDKPDVSEPSQPKYTSESAAKILLQFGLEIEDMDYLLTYPEEQLTPTTLPFILRQIRFEKIKLAANVDKSKLNISETPATESASEVNTSGEAGMHQNQIRPPCHQSSKIIDYGHTGKYTGGMGDEMGRDSCSRRESGGSKSLQMVADYNSSSHIKDPLPKAARSSTLGSSHDQAGLCSAKIPFSDPTKDFQTQPNQLPQTILSSMSLPVKDRNVQGIKSETFEPICLDKLEDDQQPVSHPQSSCTLVYGVYPSRPDPVVSDSSISCCTKGQSKSQGQCSTSTEQTKELKKQPMQQPKEHKLEQKGQQTQKQQQQNTGPTNHPIHRNVVVCKSLPTPAMMRDYSSVEPRVFPHTCSLCKKLCPHMQVWMSHLSSTLHRDNCRSFRLQFPEWDVAVHPSTSKPSSSASQDYHPKTRHGSSSSSSLPSPYRHHSSECRRDKRRSRSRSHRSSRYAQRSCSTSSTSSSDSSSGNYERKSLQPRGSLRRRQEKQSLKVKPEKSPSTRRRRERRLSPWTSRKRRSSPRTSQERWPSPRRSWKSRSLPRRSRERRSSPRRSQERRVSPRRSFRCRSLPRRSRERRSSPRRSRERRSSPGRSRERRSSPGRSRERRSSPGRSRERRSSPGRSRERRSSPWRTQDKQSSPQNNGERRGHDRHHSPSQEKTPSSPERLASKSLESSAGQTLSGQSDLKVVAKAAVLTAEREAMKAFSSFLGSAAEKKVLCAASSSSTATKEDPIKETPSFERTEVKSSALIKASKPLPPTMVRLEGLNDQLSREDMFAAVEHFGKTKSFLWFCCGPQATVCFEDVEGAEKLKNARSLSVKGLQVTVVDEKQNAPNEQKISSEREPDTTIQSQISVTCQVPTPNMPPLGMHGRPNPISTIITRTGSPTSLCSPAAVTEAKVRVSQEKHISNKQIDSVTHEETGEVDTSANTTVAGDTDSKPGGSQPPSVEDASAKADVSVTTASAAATASEWQAAPSTPPSAAAPWHTVGEMLERHLDLRETLYTKMSSPLHVKCSCLILLTDLPQYYEGCYTQRDIEKLLKRLRFQNHGYNLYIFPWACMAIAILPSVCTHKVILEVIQKEPLILKEQCHVSLRSLGNSIPMGPLAFYKSVMRLMKAPVDDDGTSIIFINNISPSDARNLRVALRKMGFVKNYLPLLNKVFIEFESVLDADRIGVWYTLLKQRPCCEIYRLKVPCSSSTSPSPLHPEKALPDSAVAVAGATIPPRKELGVPQGSHPPFWLTMPNKPFLFPTLCPWFFIPDYLTVKRESDIEEANSRGRFTTAMLTGLPDGQYKHEDIAKLVLPYFSKRDSWTLHYNVMVLPLQRRAFVYFEDWTSCCNFIYQHLRNPVSVGGGSLSVHLVLQSMKPESSEESVYKSLMNLSSAPVQKPDSVAERLLCVEIGETSADAIKSVVNIVAKITTFVNFLPLGNRICFELANSSCVTMMMEKYTMVSSSADEGTFQTWYNVQRMEPLKSFEKRLQGSRTANMIAHEEKVAEIPQMSDHSPGFRDFPLKTELLRSISDCGFKHTSKVQRECIPQAILGKDILCQAASGTGKTAAFVLATLQQTEPVGGQVSVLVICPTPQLAFQIRNEYKRFSKFLRSVKAEVLIGGNAMTKTRKKMVRKKCPHIVIGTPCYILALMRKRILSPNNIKHFVLDKCDTMFGQQEMSQCLQHIFREIPDTKQVLMFGTKLSKDIREVCRQLLLDPIEVFVEDDTKFTHCGVQQYDCKPEDSEKNQLDAFESKQEQAVHRFEPNYSMDDFVTIDEVVDEVENTTLERPISATSSSKDSVGQSSSVSTAFRTSLTSSLKDPESSPLSTDSSKPGHNNQQNPPVIESNTASPSVWTQLSSSACEKEMSTANVPASVETQSGSIEVEANTTESKVAKSDCQVSTKDAATKLAESQTKTERSSESHPTPQGQLTSQGQESSPFRVKNPQSLGPDFNDDTPELWERSKELGKEENNDNHTEESQTSLEVLVSVNDEGKALPEECSDMEVGGSFQVLDSVTEDQAAADQADSHQVEVKQLPKKDEIPVVNNTEDETAVEDTKDKENKTSNQDHIQLLDSESKSAVMDGGDGKKRKHEEEDAEAFKDGDGRHGNIPSEDNKDALKDPDSDGTEQETFDQPATEDDDLLTQAQDGRDKKQEEDSKAFKDLGGCDAQVLSEDQLCEDRHHHHHNNNSITEETFAITDNQCVTEDNNLLAQSPGTFRNQKSKEDTTPLQEEEDQPTESETKKNENIIRTLDTVSPQDYEPSKRLGTRTSHRKTVKQYETRTKVDSIKDDTVKEESLERAGRGRALRGRVEPKRTLNVRKESVEPVKGEEATCKVLDSADDNIAVTTRSTRGTSGRTNAKTAQKDDKPTRMRPTTARDSHQVSKEKSLKEKASLDVITPRKKSDTLMKVETANQLLDCVENEVKNYVPGKRKRGRPKKINEPTKKDSGSLQKGDGECVVMAEDEKEVAYQILDSVEVQDELSVRGGKRRCGRPKKEANKVKEEKEPVYHTVGSLEAKQNQDEPPTKEEAQTVKDDIPGCSTSVATCEDVADEVTSQSTKLKHDDKEESINLVTVEEVVAADKEAPTPNTRGRGRKRSRRTPVRKSTRGKKGSEKEETQAAGSDVPPPTSVVAPSSLDLEIKKTASAGQELTPEQLDNQNPGGGKRKSELVGPDAKRSRSQLSEVAAFRPDNPRGQEFLRSAYFCNVCAAFYLNETTTKEAHCSSQTHYDKLKKYYQELKQESSRST